MGKVFRNHKRLQSGDWSQRGQSFLKWSQGELNPLIQASTMDRFTKGGPRWLHEDIVSQDLEKQKTREQISDLRVLVAIHG